MLYSSKDNGDIGNELEDAFSGEHAQRLSAYRSTLREWWIPVQSKVDKLLPRICHFQKMRLCLSEVKAG